MKGNLIDGRSQETANSSSTPDRMLVSPGTASFIAPGQEVEVQVVNPDGTLSAGVKFRRSALQ